jgi:hypothetical protein
VQPDPGNDIMSQLYADIKADLNTRVHEVDELLRARFAGQPTMAIHESAESAFADIGVHLSDEQLDAYAECVSSGRPFNFALG